jgi:replicative DNA helicase
VDVEHKVICALLTGGSLAQLVDAQITTEYFPTPAHGGVFAWITAHHARYGVLPAPDTLIERWPGYALDKPSEPLAVYIDLLRAQRRRALLEEGLGRVVDALEGGNLQESENALQRAAGALAAVTPVSGHLDLREGGAARLEQYRAYAEHGDGLRGIPTGFPTLDRATLGMQNGQLIAIGGLPKGGKSALLGIICRNALEHAYRQGVELVPLLYTIEMGSLEFASRLDAWNAGLDPHKVASGSLNQAEWQRLERAIERSAAMPSFHLEKGVAHVATISQITAKLERHRPDLLAVDGIYLMRDEMTGEVGTPQAITNLTRSFKSLAQRWEIPTVITSQFLHAKVDRKKRSSGSSFGYASSFEQDADVALGLDPTDVDNIKLLKVLASRSCPNMEVHLRWDWPTGTFEELKENPFESTTGGRRASTW